MRWLLIALMVSVCVLLVISAGVAWHIRRQHAQSRRKLPGGDPAQSEHHEENEVETEEAP
jgi:hypothetical protein